MIYVYTSILSGFDNLRPPLVPKTPEVRYLCFTDNPLLPDCPPWEFRPAHLLHEGVSFLGQGDPYRPVNLARSSRVSKILPHLILPEDCEISIWHDGNFQLRADPMELISKEMRFDDWCAHKHPARDCAYEEAAVLLHENIGSASEVMAQVADMHDRQFPAHYGLWANGFIMRRHTPEVARLNEKWWYEYSRGCARDQVAFPVALNSYRTVKAFDRQYGHEPPDVTLNTLTLDVFNSPYIRHGWHAAWKDKPDNVGRRLERQRILERTTKLATVAGNGGYGWTDYR